MIKRTTEWWDTYFINLAEYVSRASKDPSTKTGAVIIGPNRRIVSLGYNGFPPRIEDTEERLNDRDIKYKLVIHAEMNAILNAHMSVRECVMYIWPFPPCSRCAVHIVASGLATVIAPEIPIDKKERWGQDIALAVRIFNEAGVQVVKYDQIPGTGEKHAR